MLLTGAILVVCTGNVCRSPYIERRLASELAATSIEVLSAGTEAVVGCQMDPSSSALLHARSLDEEGFRARQLTTEMVASCDLLIAAAREHRSAAARMHPVSLRKIITLRDLADLLEGVSAKDVAARQGAGTWVAQVLNVAVARRAVVPARQDGVDVVDPMGRPSVVFERMAEEVESALRVIVPVLRGVSVG